MKKIISLVLVACLAMSMMVMSVSAAPADDNYSRGEWIKEIAEAAGADVTGATMPEGKGVDVDENDPYYAYIAWGYTEGIVKGYAEEGFPFKGDQDVKVKEAMAMVTRAIAEEILPAVPVSVDTVDAGVASYGDENVAQAAVLYGLVGADVDWSAPVAKAPAASDEVKADVVLGVAAGEMASPIAQPNVKFQLAVKSGENADQGYVKATVYETYAMVIEISKKKVDAGHVTLEAMMNNVASLGGGVKSHKISVATGLSGDPELKVWLSNCFDFGGATINIDVDGNKCVYNVQPVVDAEEYVSIAFVPEKTEDTRAAWMALTDNVTVTTQANDDSYIFIANNSELVIGEENIVFENDSEGLKLDNFSNIDALKQTIRDNIKMGTGYTDETRVGVLVGKGTQLAVGQSIATLDKDCAIIVDGEEFDMSGCTILSDLRDAESTYAMAEKLVKMINEFVGAVDGQTVDVTVSFASVVE